MVDIDESRQAIDRTPHHNIKQKKSFAYQIFFNKGGAPKPIKVVQYAPGIKISTDEITIIRNFKIKLRKNYTVEQDFVVIPCKSGDIYLPVNEISGFCNKLNSLIAFVKGYYEKEIG
jgi:phage-related protein